MPAKPAAAPEAAAPAQPAATSEAPRLLRLLPPLPMLLRPLRLPKLPPLRLLLRTLPQPSLPSSRRFFDNGKSRGPAAAFFSATGGSHDRRQQLQEQSLQGSGKRTVPAAEKDGAPAAAGKTAGKRIARQAAVPADDEDASLFLSAMSNVERQSAHGGAAAVRERGRAALPWKSSAPCRR